MVERQALCRQAQGGFSGYLQSAWKKAHSFLGTPNPWAPRRDLAQMRCGPAVRLGPSGGFRGQRRLQIRQTAGRAAVTQLRPPAGLVQMAEGDKGHLIGKTAREPDLVRKVAVTRGHLDQQKPSLGCRELRDPSTFLTQSKLNWCLQIDSGLEAEMLPREANNNFFRKPGGQAWPFPPGWRQKKPFLQKPSRLKGETCRYMHDTDKDLQRKARLLSNHRPQEVTVRQAPPKHLFNV
nr:uncharacterized protein LOC118972031 [Manis javanica]